MSFKQKNVVVTLVNFSLIMVFYLFRLFQIVQSEGLNQDDVFGLWGVVIVMAVFVTIAATILTQIVWAIFEAIQTGDKSPKIEDMADERDIMIDLRGTKVTYSVYSLGAFVAMLTYVLDQPALVMFTMLIFFGVLAQIIGDITRLYLYRRGF